KKPETSVLQQARGTVGIRGKWLRAKRGAWICAAGAFAAAVIVAVYAAVVPTGQTLPAGSKATPFALTVFSSPSLPPEVQAQEAASAPLLFDRDTTTQHVAFDVSSVQAAFESPQSVSAIKIFGPAPYLLSVKADAGGSFQSIAGLENLNLTALPAAWNTFTAAAGSAVRFRDRKSTRLNSSHVSISYAVFCLK